MNIYHRSFTAIGVAGLAVLTACGTAGTPAGSTRSPAAAVASSPTPAFNSTDVAFARTMMMLEGQAAAMTSLVGQHAASAPVRRYAAQVRGQARASQQQARGWLRSWHRPVPEPWSPGTTPAYPMGPGMMGPAGWSGYWGDMGRGWHAMRMLRGPAFDAAWIAMMARGHAAEIAIAQREMRSGISTPARGLASAMITWRQAGLTRMRHWYRDWGGPNWNQPQWWDRWNGWNWPVRWNNHGPGQRNRWNGWNGGCGCW